MHCKVSSIQDDDIIIWYNPNGLAYGEVKEVVGKSTMVDELGEYEILIMHGTFSDPMGSYVVAELPVNCDIVILREE